MKKPDISRYFPPGYNIKKSVGAFASLAAVMMLAELIMFSTVFQNAKQYGLVWNQSHTKITDPSVKMADFNQLLSGRALPFWILALACIFWAAALYQYFKRKSSSIYIMKRLKSSVELYRRVLAAPVAMILAGLVLSIIMILIMRLIYINGVPKECMPQLTPIDFRRAFTW